LTSVVINPGVCGFVTTVQAVKTGKRRVSVTIVTDCKQTGELNQVLKDIDIWTALEPGNELSIQTQAVKHGLHSACPIPSGIVKAIEVETGLALPRDVSIHFESNK